MRNFFFALLCGFFLFSCGKREDPIPYGPEHPYPRVYPPPEEGKEEKKA